jgi:hypothetical protein
MFAVSIADVGHAEPPRAELVAGWSGNAEHGYGHLTLQPAVARAPRASVVVRGTLSRSWWGGEAGRIDASTATVGPALVWAPGPWVLSMGVGFGMRRTTTVDRGEPPTIGGDAQLSGACAWRPSGRFELVGTGTFDAVQSYLWTRAGATASVVGRPDGPVSVRAGLEWTDSGGWTGRDRELGPVAEVPLRALHTVVAVRAGFPTRSLVRADLATGRSLGLALYSAW